MLTVFYYILPILILIRIINGNRLRILDLKAENEVLALRNKLRLSAIENDRLIKHPVYVQIDYLIAESEKEIKRMNVWVLIYEVATKKRFQAEPGWDNIDERLQLKGDKDLKNFFEDYLSLHFKYLLRKDLFTYALTLIAMQTRINLSYKIKKLVANLKKDFTSHFTLQC